MLSATIIATSTLLLILSNLTKSTAKYIRLVNELSIESAKNSREQTEGKNTEKKYKFRIKWINVAFLSIFHLISINGLYLAYIGQISLKTIAFQWFIAEMTGLSTTAGSHRLWTHRAYKAKLPLRIILMLVQCSAAQNNIYDWVRDHRVHHKFSGTDADPHNINRGFFFAHCGWLMCNKHPDVIEKGKKIEMGDILSDPVVRFQKRYFLYFFLTLGLIVPVLMNLYFFDDKLWPAITARFFFYTMSLHCIWTINSVNHLWGMKPFDKNISATDNTYESFYSMGEGNHNYHHTFPWDYKTSELGGYGFNLTEFFIDSMAAIGWAYDLRMASNDMVKKRMMRSGEPLDFPNEY